MGPNAVGKCLAESIGTFALIFIGAGSICINQFTGGQPGLLGIALAHGLTIAVMVSATGHVSGGHLNPAVTFGALVTRRIAPALAVAYVVAQLAGAVVAGALLRKVFGDTVWGPVHLGATALNDEVSPGAGFAVEAVLTFFLMFVVCGTGMDPRGPKLGGLAIGGAVALDILLGGPLTGASMNPARTFGPAMAAGFWAHHWLYWAGPLLGAAAAGLLYDKLVAPPDAKP